jgi:hypothetical protein
MSEVTSKTLAHHALDALPDDASLEDVIERLVVLHKVETGRAQAQRGEGMMTQAEIEAHFARRRAARQR